MASILDNIDLSILGQLLQKAREDCGMSRVQANKVTANIDAIERGDYRLRASELIALARAYGRSVSDFVARPDGSERTPLKSFKQGLITEGRFADILGVDRLEARRIAESSQTVLKCGIPAR